MKKGDGSSVSGKGDREEAGVREWKNLWEALFVLLLMTSRIILRGRSRDLGRISDRDMSGAVLQWFSDISADFLDFVEDSTGDVV
ncbi:hypothetical protein MA16_Dca017545 [Dendrobium catenatum]|uniref:Uncharacterized protein n=1 Tax=Dendrobium catenatum TaxID=906689 RepID=A0A2I0W205_9ASPA|nr:hypothetical protein MA16_Dca017545 [Dendrobium catenatum]